MTPSRARRPSTIRFACALSPAAQVTSTRTRSAPEAVTSSAVTRPPRPSMRVGQLADGRRPRGQLEPHGDRVGDAGQWRARGRGCGRHVPILAATGRYEVEAAVHGTHATSTERVLHEGLELVVHVHRPAAPSDARPRRGAARVPADAPVLGPGRRAARRRRPHRAGSRAARLPAGRPSRGRRGVRARPRGRRRARGGGGRRRGPGRPARARLGRGGGVGRRRRPSRPRPVAGRGVRPAPGGVRVRPAPRPPPGSAVGVHRAVPPQRAGARPAGRAGAAGRRRAAAAQGLRPAARRGRGAARWPR